MMFDYSFMPSIELKALNGNTDMIIYNSDISVDRDGDKNKEFISTSPNKFANYVEANFIISTKINKKSSNYIIPLI